MNILLTKSIECEMKLQAKRRHNWESVPIFIGKENGILTKKDTNLQQATHENEFTKPLFMFK